MPTPTLNNAATTNDYSEANTVIFTQPRQGFAVNITNAAIYYQVAIPGQSGQLGNFVWDTLEHFLMPSMSNFSSPASEGFTGAEFFAGIRVRSAAAGNPARVTVI